MTFQLKVKIFACILLIGCCVTVTLQQVPIDCCLKVSSKRINKGLVVDYTEQKGGEGCAIDATIMVTKSGAKLCMTANGPWVRTVKKHVDNLRNKCLKKNFMGQDCDKVKRA